MSDDTVPVNPANTVEPGNTENTDNADTTEQMESITSVANQRGKGGIDWLTWGVIVLLASVGAAILFFSGEEKKESDAIVNQEPIAYAENNASLAVPDTNKFKPPSLPANADKSASTTVAVDRLAPPSRPSQVDKRLADEQKKRRRSPLIVADNLSTAANSETPRVSATLPDDRTADRKREVLDGLANLNAPGSNELFIEDDRGPRRETVADRLTGTTTPTVNATYLSNRSQTLMEGTLIGAVLETAIQSDLPGKLKALVTEDVYSDDGRYRLVDKGSTLIGEYQSGMQQGEARLFVIWNRLITGTGINVDLNSPGTGPLGRAGLGGWRDNHFLERFGSSLMLSVLGAYSAKTIGEGSDNTIREQIAAPFNKSAEIALENSIGIAPTIHINQGAAIKVFVNQDVDFSPVIALVTASRSAR